MRCLILMLLMISPVYAKWHMATPYGEAVFHTKNIRQMQSDLQDTLPLVVHSGASLYSHASIYRAVRTGQVQMGEVFIAMLGNKNPWFKLDNLPFLVTDFHQARDLWDSSRHNLADLLAQEGVILLYAVPWPPQGLFSRVPVNRLQDFKGHKLRAYSPTTSRLAVLLGAVPTLVQTPDIPHAFSTGVIDMMLTSVSTGVSSQAWDYVDRYAAVNAWVPKNMVIVNRAAFEALSQTQQAALLAQGRLAEQRGWQMAQRETREHSLQLAEHGMQIHPPSETLIEGLKKVGKTMADEWAQSAEQNGRDWLNAFRERE